MSDEDWTKNPVVTNAPLIAFAVIAGVIFFVGGFLLCKWFLWPRIARARRNRNAAGPRIIDLELQPHRPLRTTPAQRHMMKLRAAYDASPACGDTGPRQAPPCQPHPPEMREQTKKRQHQRHQQQQQQQQQQKWPRARGQQEHHWPTSQAEPVPTATQAPPARAASPTISDVSEGSAHGSLVSDTADTELLLSQPPHPPATVHPCRWSPAPRTHGPRPGPSKAPPPSLHTRPASPHRPNLATLFRPNNC